MSKKNRFIFYKDFKYCFFTRNGGVSKINFSSLKIEIYTFDTTFRIIMKGVFRELIDRFKKPRYPSFFLI